VLRATAARNVENEFVPPKELRRSMFPCNSKNLGLGAVVWGHLEARGSSPFALNREYRAGRLWDVQSVIL
jgi:hypothetical protein